MDKKRLISTAKYGGSSGALGGSISVILIYLISLFGHVTLPTEVVAAIVVLVTFATNVALSVSGVITEE